MPYEDMRFDQRHLCTGRHIQGAADGYLLEFGKKASTANTMKVRFYGSSSSNYLEIDAANNIVNFGGSMAQGPAVVSGAAAPLESLEFTGTGGTIARIRFPSAVVAATAYVGELIDLSTNDTPGAIAHTGAKIVIPATTRASTAGEGALVISSTATKARSVDIGIANLNGDGIVVAYPAAAILATAAMTGVTLDFQTNVTGGAQVFTGVKILAPAGTAASAAGQGAFAINSALTQARAIDVGIGNLQGNAVVVAYPSAAVLATGAFTGVLLDFSTNVTGGAQVFTGLNLLCPAGTAVGAATQGAIVVQSLMTRERIIDLGVANLSGTLVNVAYPAATVVTGATIAQNIDLATNVTPGAQNFTAVQVTMPLTGTGTLVAQNFTSPKGYSIVYGFTQESTTLSGATTDTTANLLPANSLILGVGFRVTTLITMSAGSAFTIGDATTAARFATGVALTLGTTDITNLQMGPANTNAAGPQQTAAAKIRFTGTGGNFTGGVIRSTVYYMQYVADTAN